MLKMTPLFWAALVGCPLLLSATHTNDSKAIRFSTESEVIIHTVSVHDTLRSEVNPNKFVLETEKNPRLELAVFPNPSPRKAYLHFPENSGYEHQYVLKAYSSNDELVFTKTIPPFTIQIELDECVRLPADQYELKLYEDGELLRKVAFIKEE